MDWECHDPPSEREAVRRAGRVIYAVCRVPFERRCSALPRSSSRCESESRLQGWAWFLRVVAPQCDPLLMPWFEAGKARGEPPPYVRWTGVKGARRPAFTVYGGDGPEAEPPARVELLAGMTVRIAVQDDEFDAWGWNGEGDSGGSR